MRLAIIRVPDLGERACGRMMPQARFFVGGADSELIQVFVSGEFRGDGIDFERFSRKITKRKRVSQILNGQEGFERDCEFAFPVLWGYLPFCLGARS